MAPPPEYDKEPKAPDKSVTNISTDDSKVLYNHVKEQQNNSDHKSSNTAANADIENNKHVGALDDGQLRALLDEAIAYKRPKDREGKSSLFKELLEEVEQDEQACEAAARVVTGTRGARRSGHGRRALPHSNSLQDLMAAALAAEPPRQRAHAHPPPASVSARAHHGGSLPSGVDTSSMLSEEPVRGGYLATVRCVNPPPLAERRVSASDANAPGDHDHARRGKQSFPMTYTARATLEIGGSSVSSGRAVTTTTPSNQVRTCVAHPHPATEKAGPSLPTDRTRMNTGQKIHCTATTPTKETTEKVRPYPPTDRTRKNTGQKIHCTAPTTPTKETTKKARSYPPTDHTRKNTGQKIHCTTTTPTKETTEKARSYPPTDHTRKNAGQEIFGSVPITPTKETTKKARQYPLTDHTRKNIGQEIHCTAPTTPTKETTEKARQYPPTDHTRKNAGQKIHCTTTPTKETTEKARSYLPTDRTRKNTGQKIHCTATTPTKETTKKAGPYPPTDHTRKNSGQEIFGRVQDESGCLRRQMALVDARPPTCGPPERLPVARLYHPTGDTRKNTQRSSDSQKTICDDKIGSSGQKLDCSNQDELLKPNVARTSWTDDDIWAKSVETWYEGLNHYFISSDAAQGRVAATKQRARSDLKDYQFPVKEGEHANVSDDISKNDLPIQCQPHSNEINTFKKDEIIMMPIDNTLIKDRSLSKAKLDNILKKNLVVPALSSTNPRNIRNTTIGKIEDDAFAKHRMFDNESNNSGVSTGTNNQKHDAELNNDHVSKTNSHKDNNIDNYKYSAKDLIRTSMHDESAIPLESLKAKDAQVYEMMDIQKSNLSDTENTGEIEMKDLLSNRSKETNSFSQFVNEQQKLFELLENNSKMDSVIVNSKESEDIQAKTDDVLDNLDKGNNEDKEDSNVTAVMNSSPVEKPFDNCTILTLKTKHPSPTNSSKDVHHTDKLERDSKIASKDDKKNAQSKTSAITVLLLENLFSRADKLRSIREQEIDSAIPFSCITTPEVVSGCSTTASSGQCTVAIDPKPLQLGSGYRAVACLTGGEPPRRAAPRAASPPAPPATPATPASPQHAQPRSVMSSSLNGLPLTRPGYGATGTTPAVATAVAAGASATDECKKSLDENGNSVQGFSSPLSGSSHNKKPRRKKSSKNETVIKSQEIDGYQGNKDLNEVLRFIESNAEGARGGKAGRAKHKEEDEKAAKKRSTERRKDKESKVKRATSMEELSRTKLEDLTDKPAPRAEPAKPAKAERRSWGEERDAFYLRDAEAPEAGELTDFQTVTKKRKPRRRADEPEPPRRARPPAPPSDRSNDSNDDMDSVHSLHSLPADAAPRAPHAPPPPAAHASYADIARTRHNIPDLIESCNFYAEGGGGGGGDAAAEGGGERRRARDPPPSAQAPAPGDADYPALVETRTSARRRDKAAARRKERPEGPAPDVVADRRPAVILLDCASRPGDMDGVTFGFDINEQLVGGGRRPRCDLVRDALEGAGAAAVAVAVAAKALRYLPPPHHHQRHHHTQLHQIVDYVGNAWEDVVRCGGGKVRYFSE